MAVIGAREETPSLGVLMLLLLDFFARAEFDKVVISIDKG